MNQQILSQDEVDALLQGITGESQKLEAEDAPSGGVRRFVEVQWSAAKRSKRKTAEGRILARCPRKSVTSAKPVNPGCQLLS